MVIVSDRNHAEIRSATGGQRAASGASGRPVSTASSGHPRYGRAHGYFGRSMLRRPALERPKRAVRSQECRVFVGRVFVGRVRAARVPERPCGAARPHRRRGAAVGCPAGAPERGDSACAHAPCSAGPGHLPGGGVARRHVAAATRCPDARCGEYGESRTAKPCRWHRPLRSGRDGCRDARAAERAFDFGPTNVTVALGTRNQAVHH